MKKEKKMQLTRKEMLEQKASAEDLFLHSMQERIDRVGPAILDHLYSLNRDARIRAIAIAICCACDMEHYDFQIENLIPKIRKIFDEMEKNDRPESLIALSDDYFTGDTLSPFHPFGKSED